MSVDDDDGFDAIISGVEIETPTDIVDVSTMNTATLLFLIQDLETELLNDERLLFPNSQNSRDKHSLRNAAQVELQRRKNEGNL